MPDRRLVRKIGPIVYRGIKRYPRLTIVILICAVVGSSVSEGTSTETPLADTSVVSAGPSTPKSATQRPTASAPSDSSAPTPAPSPPGELTGYGATRLVWNAHHTPAAGYDPGSAFEPFVNGGTPEYVTVSGEERILTYTLNFPVGTNVEQATSRAMQEFPPGAVVGVEDTDEPRCILLDVRTAEVEAILDGYRPMLGLFTSSAVSESFLPDHVDFAVFTVASPDEVADLGMC